MSRFGRRARRRRDRQPPRLRGMAILDVDEAASRLDECPCPAVIRPGGTTVVEHYHVHGCPSLRRYRRR